MCSHSLSVNRVELESLLFCCSGPHGCCFLASFFLLAQLQMSGLVSGHSLWQEWLHESDPHGIFVHSRFAALFDCHDVVDTCNTEEACDLASELEHLFLYGAAVPSLLCSFGKNHCLSTFCVQNPWYPLVCQFDGYVFTEYRERWAKTPLSASRPEGYPSNAIRLSGDKSDVSRLLKMPTILFDDKESNADIHDRGNSGNWSVVVKRGRKWHHSWMDGYYYSSDVQRWPDIIKEFADHTMADDLTSP